MKNWPDQLYRLMPAVHQIRDGSQHEALRAFLQIVGEQAQQIQDDVEQLYDNWFIETADDWVVPYLGDLVGFRRSGASGEPADAITSRGQLLNRFLYPRREIANLVRRRRRKGTLSVLEDMAKDVSGWPSRAVEFSRLVTFFQSVKHPLPEMGRTFSLRDVESHPRVNTPFDRVAHTVDLRSIQPLPGVGWYHPKKVGLFVWRRKVLPATMVCPCRSCRKFNHSEIQYYTFSRLGIERPIYVRPIDESDELHIADESNLPVPLYRHLLADEDGHPKDVYYGLGSTAPKSLAIYVKSSTDADWSLVPAEKIWVMDLCDEERARQFHKLCCDQIAVDPERGIFVIGCKNDSQCSFRVSYHYAATMDVGGGEYKRSVIDKPDTLVVRVRNENCCTNANLFETALAEIPKMSGRECGCQPARDKTPLVKRVPAVPGDTLDACREATWIVEEDLCIEITDSDTFQVLANETLCIRPNKTLIIRAADEAFPLLHLNTSEPVPCPAPWKVQMGEGSTLVIDGLLVCGATMQLVEGGRADKLVVPVSKCRPCDSDGANGKHSSKGIELHLRHTTFVPGGRADRCFDCQHSSLCLSVPLGKVVIRHSIVGTLNVEHSKCSNCGGHQPKSKLAACPLDPIAIEITDSIVDAAHDLPAIYSNCCSPAHADLTIERSTILGDICVQQMTRAEDSLFAGIVHVQRRGQGYMRFCYVPNSLRQILRLPAGSHCESELALVMKKVLLWLGLGYDVSGADCCDLIRTPPRFKCLPDTRPESNSSLCSTGCRPTQAQVSKALPCPHFVSSDYGHPGYCELTLDCDVRILQGSEDQSEFGVFHDLYRPQRAAALDARLQEYTPADMQSAAIFADDLDPAIFEFCRRTSP